MYEKLTKMLVHTKIYYVSGRTSTNDVRGLKFMVGHKKECGGGEIVQSPRPCIFLTKQPFALADVIQQALVRIVGGQIGENGKFFIDHAKFPLGR